MEAHAQNDLWPQFSATLFMPADNARLKELKTWLGQNMKGPSQLYENGRTYNKIGVYVECESDQGRFRNGSFSDGIKFSDFFAETLLSKYDIERVAEARGLIQRQNFVAWESRLAEKHGIGRIEERIDGGPRFRFTAYTKEIADDVEKEWPELKLKRQEKGLVFLADRHPEHKNGQSFEEWARQQAQTKYAIGKSNAKIDKRHGNNALFFRLAAHNEGIAKAIEDSVWTVWKRVGKSLVFIARSNPYAVKGTLSDEDEARLAAFKKHIERGVPEPVRRTGRVRRANIETKEPAIAA